MEETISFFNNLIKICEEDRRAVSLIASLILLAIINPVSLITTVIYFFLCYSFFNLIISNLKILAIPFQKIKNAILYRKMWKKISLEDQIAIFLNVYTQEHTLFSLEGNEKLQQDLINANLIKIHDCVTLDNLNWMAQMISEFEFYTVSDGNFKKFIIKQNLVDHQKIEYLLDMNKRRFISGKNLTGLVRIPLRSVIRNIL